MLKMLKKAICIDYEEGNVYPDVAHTHAAIAKYCRSNGHSCEFTGDEEVVIDGITHEIYRGLSMFSRGNYIIKLTEK